VALRNRTAMDMHHVITTCTNRKRATAQDELRARNLTPAPQAELGKQWISRLIRMVDPAMLRPASDLYCGRGFQEALLAAKHSGNLSVVSAGLGLVSASTEVPAYELTVSRGSPDSVHANLDGPFSPNQWWKLLRESPFSAMSLQGRISDERCPLVICALSSPYYAMLAEDLLALPAGLLERVRLVGIKSDRVHPGLRHTVMPYDDRLDSFDSEYQGTRSDFPQRAARHFVERVLCEGLGTASEDRQRVEKSLRHWKPRRPPERRRLTDDEIRTAIQQAWPKTGGLSGRTLRYLRDDLGIACEQGRFKKLFHDVRDRHMESTS
jgi:hypothetical protein